MGAAIRRSYVSATQLRALPLVCDVVHKLYKDSRVCKLNRKEKLQSMHAVMQAGKAHFFENVLNSASFVFASLL